VKFKRLREIPKGMSPSERSLDTKLRVLEGEKRNDMGKEILISKQSGVEKHSFMLRYP
jgi:hypothetical protein